MNYGRVVDDRTICNTDCIVTLEIPGCPDHCARIDVTVRSDHGAKLPQEKRSPPVKGSRREPEKNRVDNVPNETPKLVAERKNCGKVWIALRAHLRWIGVIGALDRD